MIIPKTNFIFRHSLRPRGSRREWHQYSMPPTRMVAVVPFKSDGPFVYRGDESMPYVTPNLTELRRTQSPGLVAVLTRDEMADFLRRVHRQCRQKPALIRAPRMIRSSQHGKHQ